MLRPGLARISQHCALLLMACALAMRVLLPSGFMLMPVPGATLPTLVICTGQGAVTMSMADMPGMAMPAAAMGDMQAQDRGTGHHDDGEKHPCAFAVASAAVDLATTAHPAMPVRRVAFAPIASRGDARPGLGLAAPPPPQTGPPILS